MISTLDKYGLKTCGRFQNTQMKLDKCVDLHKSGNGYEKEKGKKCILPLCTVRRMFILSKDHTRWQNVWFSKILQLGTTSMPTNYLEAERRFFHLTTIVRVWSLLNAIRLEQDFMVRWDKNRGFWQQKLVVHKSKGQSAWKAW